MGILFTPAGNSADSTSLVTTDLMSSARNDRSKSSVYCARETSNGCHNISMISRITSDSILGSLRKSTVSGLDFVQLALEEINMLENYNWSGVYILDGGVLKLGPYIGAATEHTEIPVGQGVCGTAVATRSNQVVTDVRKLTNYLACSVGTRAEIVVLIKRGDEILGQIDIDSDKVGAFDESDEKFLERVAELMAARWTS